MNGHALLLFSLAVLPLVCTPGPDILFVASQAVAGGARPGLRATAGVLLGYSVHAVLVALGLAAVIAASPVLFETIRWVGIAYLVYLAFKLIRSACTKGALTVEAKPVRDQLRKGFLTALLNPKGMMVYVAILPQFMTGEGSAALQAVSLSAAFIFWCALIYSAVCLAVSAARSGIALSDTRRRAIDGGAGGMILLAAGFMATSR